MVNESDVEDFLEHFGVRGMRWGVRKNPERQWEKKATSRETRKALRRVVNKPEHEALFRRIEKKNPENDTSIRSAKEYERRHRLYENELTVARTRIMQAHLDSLVGRSPSGRRAIVTNPFFLPRVEFEEVEHADNVSKFLSHYGITN